MLRCDRRRLLREVDVFFFGSGGIAPYPSFLLASNPERTPHRSSKVRVHPQEAAFRSAPHAGQRPAQLGWQSGFCGSNISTYWRNGSPRSSTKSRPMRNPPSPSLTRFLLAVFASNTGINSSSKSIDRGQSMATRQRAHCSETVADALRLARRPRFVRTDVKVPERPRISISSSEIRGSNKSKTVTVPTG